MLDFVRSYGVPRINGDNLAIKMKYESEFSPILITIMYLNCVYEMWSFILRSKCAIANSFVKTK